VTANASASAVCAGTSVSLTGSGNADNYTWTGGVTNGTAFIPSTTSTYTVTGTNTSSNCQNTATATVIVNPLPTVFASASLLTVCAGSNVTLTGSGNGNTYTWSDGVVNGVPFVPSGTSTYTLTGTNTATGCQNTAATTITVNPLPTVVANASTNNICAGSNVTLTGSGNATTYAWSDGVVNGVPFVPSGTSTYTLTGTNSATSCQNTATATITVNTVDNSVSQTDNTLTANATDATYQWINCNNGFTAIPGATNKNFTAATNGSYAVLVTQNNCTDTSACYAVIISGTDDYASNKSQIAIFPNPFSAQTILQRDNAFNNASLTICNLEGKIVKRLENISGNTIVFQRENLPSGVYFLRLTENNKVLSVHKLVIVD
jgi:hypothetical protein